MLSLRNVFALVFALGAGSIGAQPMGFQVGPGDIVKVSYSFVGYSTAPPYLGLSVVFYYGSDQPAAGEGFTQQLFDSQGRFLSNPRSEWHLGGYTPALSTSYSVSGGLLTPIAEPSGFVILSNFSGSFYLAAVDFEATNGISPTGYYRGTLEKLPPGYPVPAPAPAPITPVSGLWWNSDESGSGYALDYKNGVLVVTVYSYGTTGEPVWYLATGRLSTANFFSATLDRYRGGQCIACSYPGRPQLVGNDGTVTIQFHTSSSATMGLPGGRRFTIKPQPW